MQHPILRLGMGAHQGAFSVASFVTVKAAPVVLIALTLLPEDPQQVIVVISTLDQDG